MKPANFPEANTVFAKDQPQYLPLPAHHCKDAEGRVIFCWKLNRKERRRLARRGVIWQHVLTFNQPLQPQLLSTDSPFQS